MADRIRSNWKAVKAEFNDVTEAHYADPGPLVRRPVTGVCDPETQAERLGYLWKSRLESNCRGLGDNCGRRRSNVSCVTPSAACSFNVTVSWNESGYRAADADNAQFEVAKTRDAILVQP